MDAFGTFALVPRRAFFRVGIALFAFLALETAYSQSPDVQVVGAEEVSSSFRGITGRLDAYIQDAARLDVNTRPSKVGYQPKEDWPLHPKTNPNALPLGEDPVLQRDYPQAVPRGLDSLSKSSNMPLGVNIDGLSSGSLPLDPSMDVGPNHVIQMINGGGGARMRIWDKEGSPVTDVIQFEDFFGFDFGGGDPIVLYDHAADRWLVTEFKNKVAGNTFGHELYLAMSTGPDPLGTWYTYQVSTPVFPDYPKYSMWSDLFLVTTNEPNECGFYVLDRSAMLTGAPLNAQRFDTPDVGLGFLAGAPVHWDGDTPPPAGENVMAMRMLDDGWGGVASDALEFWELDIDFDNAANSVLSLVEVLEVSPFDSELCSFTGWSCVPQPGEGVPLDPLLEVLMHRVQYRNFGTHESIVCCHTTDVGLDRAGIRWYELRRINGSNWVVYQEGTYSPDTEGRFMGTVAMDDFGNIALGYNLSSSTTFPSIRFTGRNVGGPLGQMTWPEETIQTGSGVNASSRYGDYNQMAWDPASGSFWMTAMYNTDVAMTRIAQIEVVRGCTDPLACNYDTDADGDDGSCLYPGCTTLLSCNYDPNAGCNDGSCCTGNCLNLSMPFGFFDFINGTSTFMDYFLSDSQTGEVIASGNNVGFEEGPTAEFCLESGCYTLTITGYEEGAWSLDLDPVIFLPGMNLTIESGTGPGTVSFSIGGSGPGCTDPEACNYDDAAVCDDGSCCLDNCGTLVLSDSYGDGWNGGILSLSDAFGFEMEVALDSGAGDTLDVCLPDGCLSIGVTAGIYPTEIGWSFSFGDYSIAGGAPFSNYITLGTVMGCMEPEACNFNPAATCPDGSCIDPGCMDPAACNFSECATCDGGIVCSYGCNGCMYPDATNYDPDATNEDGTCTFDFAPPPSLCQGDVDNDGQVAVTDILIVLGEFGSVCTE